MRAPAAASHRTPLALASARPIVRWAGGKTHLVPELLDRLPELRPGARCYEPFAGGAALFFALTARRPDVRFVLGDANADLIATYRAVAIDVEDVIGLLDHLAVDHDVERYLERRDDWNAGAWATDAAARAAMFLYLNRTCFNGLWRVNRDGEFNVGPDPERSAIIDAENLRAASTALRRAELRCGDYRETIADARAGDLVYLDSPYDRTFASYTAGGFGTDEQRALSDEARRLVGRGVHVIASNADTPRIRELYSWARIGVVRCARAINSDGAGRGAVDELIITAGPSRRRKGAR